MGTYYCFRGRRGCDHIVVITTKVVSSQGLNFVPKVHWSRTSVHQAFTGPGPVSTNNLLVLRNFLLILNIGMEEIKFVENKIYLSSPPPGSGN